MTSSDIAKTDSAGVYAEGRPERIADGGESQSRRFAMKLSEAIDLYIRRRRAVGAYLHGPETTSALLPSVTTEILISTGSERHRLPSSSMAAGEFDPVPGG